MNNIQQTLYQQGQTIDSINRKVDFYMEWQAQQFTYMVEVHATLASLIATLHQPGGDMIQIPQPPAYQPYSSARALDEDDVDQEEGDEDEGEEEEDDADEEEEEVTNSG